MKRNLSNRVEAIVPIEDPRLQAQITTYFRPHRRRPPGLGNAARRSLPPAAAQAGRQSSAPRRSGKPASAHAARAADHLTTARRHLVAPEPTGFARRITHQKRRRRSAGGAGSMVRHVFLQTRTFIVSTLPLAGVRPKFPRPQRVLPAVRCPSPLSWRDQSRSKASLARPNTRRSAL